MSDSCNSGEKEKEQEQEKMMMTAKKKKKKAPLIYRPMVDSSFTAVGNRPVSFSSV